MVRQNCSRCDTVPENILVLECSHTVCLGCASALIDAVIFSIRCYACGFVTQIDSDIVEQLMPAVKNNYRYHNNNKQRAIQRQSQDQYSHNNREKSLHKKDFQSFNSHYSFGKNSASQHMASKIDAQNNKQIQCKYHREYQIMYLCLDCNHDFACPECVIHGSHKNHNVISFKVFIKSAEQNLKKQLNLLNESSKSLLSLSETRQKQIRQRISQINRLKSVTLHKFQMIRKQISKQENSLLEELEILLNYYQNDIHSVECMTNKDLSILQDKQKQIHQIIEPLYTHGIKITRKDQYDVIIDVINFKQSEEGKKKKNSQILNGEYTDRQDSQKTSMLEILTDRIQNIGYECGFSDKAQKKLIETLSRSQFSNGNRQMKQSIYKKLDKQNSGNSVSSSIQQKQKNKIKSSRIKKSQQQDFLIF